MAASVGRPSRRKNEPGILPAAYARSSTSTVRGKKSIPSRTPLAALAVARTVVRPIEATTAPIDCWASRPVSNERVLSVPATGPDTRLASAMRSSFRVVIRPGWERWPQFSVGNHPEIPGDWRLTTGVHAAHLVILAVLIWKERPPRPLSQATGAGRAWR